MFKVECPGCKAPFQVDERRVPAAGLKMRCPKCGESFRVDPPPRDPRQTGPSPVLQAEPRGAPAGPPPVPRRPRAATIVGVAAPGGGAQRPPAAPPPPTPVPAAPPPPASGDELDLPVVGVSAPRAPGRPAPPPRPSAHRTSPDAPRARDLAAAPPAPAAPHPPAPAAFGEIDLDAPELPSPAGFAAGGAPRAGGPAPSPAAPDAFDLLDDDLPSLGGHGAAQPTRGAPAASDFDLPTVGGAAAFGAPPRGGFDDLELPALAGPAGDLPALPDVGFPGTDSLDLPSVGGAELPSLGGVELPSFGGADLPGLGGAELPSLGGADLPSVGGAELPTVGGTGLPALGGAALPALGGAALPALGGAALPAISSSGLPALGGAALPATAAPPSGGLAAFGDLEAPDSLGRGDAGAAWPQPTPPRASASSVGAFAAFGGGGSGGPPSAVPSGEFPGDRMRAPSGEFAMPARSSFEPPASDPFGGPSSAPPAPGGPSQPPSQSVPQDQKALTRQAGGGVSFGEVDLGGGEEAGLGDEMEFGAIPQERDASAEASMAPPGGPLHAPVATAPTAPVEAPRSRRGGRYAVVAAVLFVVGGGALATLPDVGPFGYHVINDTLRKGEYDQRLRDEAARARVAFARDTFDTARTGLQDLEAAREGARRIKGLAAYGAYAAFLHELRFGAAPDVNARAQVALKALEGGDGVPHYGLALAAQAGVGGQLARAVQLAQQASGREPEKIDVVVLEAELALRARDAGAAVAAWTTAEALEKSPRTAFGLARALQLSGDGAGASARAKEALARNPAHVGARLLEAGVLWATQADEKAASALLTEVVGSPGASPEEVVRAQTLLGDIHLGRSRVSLAEAAYGEALKIDPKWARALAGLGDAFYRAGRYSEALARFQAAAEADADFLLAQVGVAKTTIALERLNDAKEMLRKLRVAHPKSVIVAYWDGKVQEALGMRPEAEAAYRAAVAAGPTEPDAVLAYVALALVLNQQGRGEEAQKILADAKEKLPTSPLIHRALGELALAQGRYDDALAELARAVGIDPTDLDSRFKLGIAHRRKGNFEDATKAFDAVAAVDRDYPGLALERGLLFEASGRTEEALRAYEGALAKAPNDPDLMLRVGCSKVAAGRPEQAEELLRKVLSQRQQSAETNHCLGRAMLLKGQNLAEALRTLERAVELDPNRAEYYLYVGWAANEAGRVAKAEEALRKALALDQGLADAYWQRGVLSYRQGRVRDAIADLRKALELRPSRHEAHATLAEAYYDEGKEAQAIAEWELAVRAHPDNAMWRYRYGRLLAANNRAGEAADHLGRAIQLGEAAESKPRWLPDAHLLYARALGTGKDAARHWEAFLRDGPRDSPYRDEAKRALAAAGRPWQGD
ncbi:MAG: zinc-ribbon domain-containing protein [Polyangiaceae bacterium]|nr:zinc-ribbon domain-containing protein [Polyangiaceae bacterium]